MCGGAIISDFVPTKPGRKSTSSHDFWSDLDTFADLLGFDPSSISASQHPKPPVSSDDHNNLPTIPPTTPGEFFFIYFLCQIIAKMTLMDNVSLTLTYTINLERLSTIFGIQNVKLN